MVTVLLGPAKVDISGVRAGDRNEFQINLTADGDPMDLTGMTASASARVSTAATTHLDAVVDITDEPGGVIRIHWPGDAVRTWLGTNTRQSGVWDLQLGEEDTGTTIVAGSFTAEMDVTHD
jgi:hypothetical protein